MSRQIPETTVVEVVLSEESAMHITQQAVTFTPTLLHPPVPPTHLARHQTLEQQEKEQDRSQPQSLSQDKIAKDNVTTLFGTRTGNRPTLPSTITTPPPSLETITTSIISGTTTTVITITRAHRPAATSTQTSYVDQWPQIGFILTESELPRQWRETYEEKALRQQYIALGCICAIFVVGVLGVLGFGMWKCVRERGTGGRERAEEGEGKWDWF